MDPVTGLSRRQMIALAAIIPLGVIASTAATAISERVDAPCPDLTYECATIQHGEPVVIGLVAASEQAAGWPLGEAIERAVEGKDISGYPVRVDLRIPGCSAEAASEDVRELVSDPPEEPPAAVLVGAHCRRAAAPMAQISSDTGTTLVSLDDPGEVPTDPRYHLIGPRLDLEGEASGLQGVGLASHLRDLIVGHLAGILEDMIATMQRLAIVDGQRLLIPRTPLRDALISEGYSRA